MLSRAISVSLSGESHQMRGLRCVPVESIDFLGAGIAQNEWGIVGAQSGPGTKDSERHPDISKAHHTLYLPVADSHTKDPGLGFQCHIVEVNVLSIAGPVMVTHASFG